jgi:hypothetical protein
VCRKNIYLAWFALHFVLITAISVRELFSLIAGGLTIIPSHGDGAWSEAEKIASVIAGQSLAPANPARKTLVGYMHGAGIEGAFGFFAPNVPESYKLVFEFRYPDGRVEEDLPDVQSHAAGLRLGSLLDRIGRSNSEQFRRILIRMLTSAAWDRHPDAVSARAVFGTLKLPDPAQFERGLKPSYEFSSAYEFTAGVAFPDSTPQ